MAGEVTLGPVLFNWPVEMWRDFYFEIADEAPVERVYVGEVVCSKRAPLFEKHMDEVIARLESAGKKPILSTLAEVSNALDRLQVKRNTTDSDCAIEANDVSALWHLEGKPHDIGPYMNVYNEDSLRFFVRKGAQNICLPPEMPASGIAELGQVAKELDVTLEVQVYGRIPLALSARCYHARAHGLTKDTCKFICDRDDDGMVLNTLDDKPFLVINGIQTMSYRCLNLTHELEELSGFGVNRFRISPHAKGTLAVTEIFRSVLDQTISPDEATARLQESSLSVPFSNGFYHQKAGIDWQIGSAAR